MMPARYFAAPGKGSGDNKKEGGSESQPQQPSSPKGKGGLFSKKGHQKETSTPAQTPNKTPAAQEKPKPMEVTSKPLQDKPQRQKSP
jgi:hypothetical protein